MKQVVAFLFGVLVLTFATNGFAQSVASVARQERERQRAAHSTVVITSLGAAKTPADAPPAAGAPAAAAAAAATPAGPTGAQVTDNKGRDEKFWRTEFQKARDDVKRADSKVEVLETKINNLNTQILQRSEIYNRENVLGAELTAAKGELEAATKEAELAKLKLTGLEDDLRKSGGPAGWAR